MKVGTLLVFVLGTCLGACAAPVAEPESDLDTSEAEQSTRRDAGADAASAATSFVDARDGRTYRTVQLGGKTWLAENLAFEVPGESFCYGDDPARCATDGRLYTWRAARTACPASFRLATDEDWKSLEGALGMAASQRDLEGYGTPRGTNEGTRLKSPSGFAAKMAGYRGNGTYDARGDRTYFWVGTTRGTEVWRRRIAAATPQIFRFTNPPADFAISVRCVSER